MTQTIAVNVPTPDYAIRGLNPERLAAVKAHAGPEVLDVGCGNGGYVLSLADSYRIRGLDHRRFDAWDQRPDLFEVGDAQRLGLPDNSTDTILSFETLEHLPEPLPALKEYFRVCRRNLIITVPNCSLTPGMRGSGVIFNHWIDRTHVNFWDIDTLSQLVAEAGFLVEHRQHINHINLGPVVMEALGFGGSLARRGAALFRRLQRRRYPMTCLVVAAKRPAPC
jgi:SAM-dependent methyltransferase